MKNAIRITLHTTPEQDARLQALQAAFAQVCNALAPLVQQTRLWNRVALHHLYYRRMREQFPALGSQMVCNAIYAVSRTCRLVYMHPGSPFNLSRMGDKALPLLLFGANNPVYFDRHTLSVTQGQLSLFTLGGRMRFAVGLSPQEQAIFQTAKVREILLSRRAGEGPFELAFWLEPRDAPQGDDEDEGAGLTRQPVHIPDYVNVQESA